MSGLAAAVVTGVPRAGADVEWPENAVVVEMAAVVVEWMAGVDVAVRYG